VGKNNICFKRELHMAKEKASKLKYQVILEEYLKSRDWGDELEVDLDEGSVTLNTGVKIGDQGGSRLIIVASDKTDLVDVFFYYSTSCKKSKMNEMRLLISEINFRIAYGKWQVLPDGDLRWMHRVDFEGSSPTPQSIHQIVQPGWNLTERWLEPIAAVALTKQSAADALSEFDEAQNATAKAENGDAPTEL